MARAARIPLRQRLLSVLVCLHLLAPALAAVVDAWRLDGRVAYAHVESEGGDGCVPVHTPASPCLRRAAQAPTPLEPHRNSADTS